MPSDHAVLYLLIDFSVNQVVAAYADVDAARIAIANTVAPLEIVEVMAGKVESA